MTRLERWLMVAVLVLLFGVYGTRAQNPLVTSTYWTVPNVAFSVTQCPTPPTGFTAYCITGATIQTINSSGVATPFLTGAAAGVTSWNGLTGAVTYTAPTPPVTSVNGKTGAVILGATTTLQ